MYVSVWEFMHAGTEEGTTRTRSRIMFFCHNYLFFSLIRRWVSALFNVLFLSVLTFFFFFFFLSLSLSLSLYLSISLSLSLSLSLYLVISLLLDIDLGIVDMKWRCRGLGCVQQQPRGKKRIVS